MGAAAFRCLLTTGTPVSVERLAARLDLDVAEVRSRLDALTRQGRARLDAAGAVLGACGLTVVPTRHQLAIGERRLWTWCACDAVGILGALLSSGSVRSASVATGRPIRLRFREGAPADQSPVLVMPDREGCVSLVDEWCPHVNFAEDRATALSWLASSGLAAAVIPVADATSRGAREWSPMVAGLGLADG